MDENEKNKKKASGKKPDTDAGKEHKKNWRELQATTGDIRSFFSENVLLRHNVITGKPEIRVPPADAFTHAAMLRYPNGLTALDEWRSATQWFAVTDRFVNTVVQVISITKEARTKDVWTVIESDFAPLYNPLKQYLDHLPPPRADRNAILDLAMTVTVKGGTAEQAAFYVYLRKWLVGMVAGWVDEQAVNQSILVLVGRQGIYKTTWFNNLMPPELQPYFHSNTSFGNMTKDEVLKLSQYGLICCEELDTLKPSEMNRLKWAVTTPYTDERQAYAHHSERRKHIASYCGTGNNVEFINDVTGSRRWLPFEVESIASPYDHPIDHDAIFAEAYQLYKQGFQYWFSEEESAQHEAHNERFKVVSMEEQAISRRYRQPLAGEKGEFVSCADIMQAIGNPLMQQMTLNGLGRAMRALKFERVRSHGQRGYRVVAYTPEEIKANSSLLAYDAVPEITEIPEIPEAPDDLDDPNDANDTIF